MSNDNEKTQEAGQIAPSVTRTRKVSRRGHRLTAGDMKSLAALVALRASEAEACALLKIPYSTWSHFKSRNAERFAVTLDAIRAAKLKSHLANVEKFSKVDWRASVAYLEKTMPEKYSNKLEVIPPAPNGNQISEQTLVKVLDMLNRTSIGDKPASLPALPLKSAVPPMQLAETATPDAKP